MKKILIPIILFILVTSCQKEFTFVDDGTPADSVGTGRPCDSYYPTSQGTFWTYSNTQAPDNTLTVSSPDTLINGKTFKRIKSAQQPDFFVRDDNGSIYQYVNLGGNGEVLMNVLRVNAIVGDTWSDVSIVNGVTETFNYEILEKNITFQVNNAIFPDVIHSQYTVTLDAPPFFNNEVVQVTEAWFAKCVGPLQSSTVGISSGIPSSPIILKLKSYQVK